MPHSLLSTACGDDVAEPTASGTPTDSVVEVHVVDGDVVGGAQDIGVSIGSHVQLLLTGDADEEIHVHGYDLHLEPVNGVGELVFDAEIPGIFEIELEGSGRVVVRLTVS